MVSPLDQLSEECNRLVFEAANEDSLSKLQIANGTYSPIQLLTSLAHCNGEGETPLVVAMKRKNIPVIKEMVTWMLDYKNHLFHKKECKSMPIFIIDQLSHHIPVLQSKEWYEKYGHHGINNVYRGDRKSWLELMDLVFLQSTSLTRHDKIIALELTGALAIIHCCNNSMSRFALKCWREAMALRYFPQDGEPLLPKVPAICVPTRASEVIFWFSAEIMTMEQLKLLEEDFERNSLSFDGDLIYLFEDQLLIHALLVIRRIVTQTNLEHPHWLYLESILGYATSLNMRATKHVINTYLFIFEQLNGYDPKLLSRRSFNVFTSTIGRTHFFLQFYNLARGPKIEHEYDKLVRVELTFDSLLALTKFIVKISEFFPNPAMISSVRFYVHFAEIVYDFLCILEDISPQITDQQKHQLEENFSYFIRNFFPERTNTVLHVAAKEAHMATDVSVCFFGDRDKDELKKTLWLKPIHTQIKLILQLGADVNAIDEMGLTPLHILAPMQGNHWKEYVKIFQTLVDAGSHLYLADDYGETVISILKKTLGRGEIVDPYFESLLNDVFPLTCLCARVIRRHRIPFKDQLPLTLQKLVSP